MAPFDSPVREQALAGSLMASHPWARVLSERTESKGRARFRSRGYEFPPGRLPSRSMSAAQRTVKNSLRYFAKPDTPCIRGVSSANTMNTSSGTSHSHVMSRLLAGRKPNRG